MDSTEELQQLEITALKSIFGNDFIECPPPKAWKGAARLHEFMIQVTNPEFPDKISVHLHVKLPKTYPHLACPTFTLQKPAKGLSNDQISKLQQLINAEAQKQRGNEMVFTITTTCQDWLVSNVTPLVEVPGSLAVQMTQRALEEEKNRKLREAEDAAREEALRQKEAEELEEQIAQDALRQMIAREQQSRSRQRANSEATEVPYMSDTPLETFNNDIVLDGVRFNTVKLFHPRQGPLQTIYLAEPVVDDVKSTLPLEMHIYTFESSYYSTSQGRKKLKATEEEILQLTSIRHENLISVLAVKLKMPNSSDPSQLIILMEQAPHITLHDVLSDSHPLREDRATQYVTQILKALNAIHDKGLVHRGISTRCIGLASSRIPGQKVIKLGKAVFHTRLQDLHRSNSFGPHVPPLADEEDNIGDGWLSRDAKNESVLLYTKRRDLHNVGIVLMQMLVGLDVTEQYADIQEAIHSSAISPVLARQASNMLLPTKKNISAMNLLSELAEDMMTQQLVTPQPSRTMPISINNGGGGIRTPVGSIYSGSPEIDYLTHRVMRPRHASRWKDDWEELELLGKGAFGSVVKARNRIDSRIYAVKKVRLKATRNDDKIMREVNALSRLNHRFIVRYYTTWIETTDAPSTVVSDDSSAESSMVDTTSVPPSPSEGGSDDEEVSERHLPVNGGFANLSDLDDMFDDQSSSNSHNSFQSIHFEGSQTMDEEGSSGGSDSEFDDMFLNGRNGHNGYHGSGISPTALARGSANRHTPTLAPSRTLYIQMEFVERQTLKERIDEGVSEDEAWRLFHQIVDALVHMSNLGILHRDIKLTNIFIDAKGDCKVGDFGLATSSLAAVDPSDVQPRAVSYDADMTLEVGTRLYIAPEVQSRGGGHRATPRNHSKADMYSLGIVFFEMNYKFYTGSERIAVLEDLRRPGIFFPASWDPHRTRQKEIITWLLQHNPDKRPTALDLSQSPLLPPRVEDEYFNQALSMMAKPDTPHYQTVLSLLFNQPIKASRGVLYDKDLERPEYLALADAAQDRLAALFKLHGAVAIEPPLLLPVVNRDKEDESVTLIDRTGNLVSLPSNLLVPFARLAAKGNVRRIKRYHIANVYRPNPVAGHPIVQKAAVFDIITQDLQYGPIAAGAEIISVASDILNTFPNLNGTFNIRVSHSSIIEHAMGKVAVDQKAGVVEILTQSKSSVSQKRALLLKKGLTRSLIEELEILNESEETIDQVLAKLEKIGSSLLPLIRPAAEELKSTLQHASFAGLDRPVIIHPLMFGNHHSYFNDGILVEITHKSKVTNVLASGGRYDALIMRHSPTLRQTSDSLCALGLHVSLEKILVQLGSFHSSSIKNLIKEERSFGYWSPRRCDVYVVSYHTGYLQERLEVVNHLWKYGISADVMYENAIADVEHERLESVCEREGILFTVYPRPRTAKQSTQSAFRVKSILKGTEYDLSRSELATWLQQHIADQKRVDLTTYGATPPMELQAAHNTAYTYMHGMSPATTSSKDAGLVGLSARGGVGGGVAGVDAIQLVLPTDVKKQRKQVKHIFSDRAFEASQKVKSSIHNMPTIAIDVPPSIFDSMCRSSSWLTDDDAWKTLLSNLATANLAKGKDRDALTIGGPVTSQYLSQIKETVSRCRSEGCAYVMLYAVREERLQLLALS